MAPRPFRGWLRPQWESQAISCARCKGFKVVFKSLHLLLAICHTLCCVVLGQPLPCLHWHTPSIDWFIRYAMGRAEAFEMGTLEYEKHTSYCKSHMKSCLISCLQMGSPFWPVSLLPRYSGLGFVGLRQFSHVSWLVIASSIHPANG